MPVKKIGDEQVPYICVLIKCEYHWVHYNVYSKHACDSF